jgi:hypothetical protein
MMRLASAHIKQAGRLGGIVMELGGFRNCDGWGLDAPSGHNDDWMETL